MTVKPRVQPEILALVMAGGAVGATIRELLTILAGGADTDSGPSMSLLVITMSINLVGAFLLGALTGVCGDERPGLRAFVGTGVLGGFTTYSALAVHTVSLQAVAIIPARGALLAAGGYLLLTVAGGLLLATLGVIWGRRGYERRNASSPDASGPDVSDPGASSPETFGPDTPGPRAPGPEGGSRR